MMETLVQPYTPHLKKVLKKYQLSAVKSLQGPSTLLGPPPCLDVTVKATTAASATGPAATATEPVEESPAATSPAAAATVPDAPDTFLPPPFPVQQLPILTEADQRGERGETVLEGESISCFVVGGERRLCLPQVLNSVLRNFTLAQINQKCDELQIFCSRCNPEQLEELKVTGILPASAPSCGLITKTDAERLCSSLLRHGVAASHPSPGAASFEVYHECFGKCRGLCTPSLFSGPASRCIQCFECSEMFTPQHFVCHTHPPRENRTCHWGFDSSNWRSYLLVSRGQRDYDVAVNLLAYFKEKNVTVSASAVKRKNHHSECQSKSGPCVGPRSDAKPEVTVKKPKVEESPLGSPTQRQTPPTTAATASAPDAKAPAASSTPDDATRSHNGDKVVVDDVVVRLKQQQSDVPPSKESPTSQQQQTATTTTTSPSSPVPQPPPAVAPVPPPPAPPSHKLSDDGLRPSIGIKTIEDGALRSLKGYTERDLKAIDDSYSAYLQYAPESYIYWYNSWRTSAFRPWPSLATIKDSKSASILRDGVPPQSVPAYLSQGPPVLLHPERVIPLSESERFERSFQPNVALAPPASHHHRPKVECTDGAQVKCEPESIDMDSKKPVIICPPPPSSGIVAPVHPADTKPVTAPGATPGSRYNPEIELSTDTDDSSSETAPAERCPVPRGERVVEQVAEVLDALSDAKEATRARVVALVQELASRLNLEEANVRRLEEENSELRHVQREQEDLLASKDRRIAQLQQRLKEAESSNKQQQQQQEQQESGDGFQDKTAGAPADSNNEVRTSHADMNGSVEATTGAGAGGGSPVSVIQTSSPSLVIKTEPSE